jgi:DNA-binding NarL/FixJ family response regulator
MPGQCLSYEPPQSGRKSLASALSSRPRPLGGLMTRHDQRAPGHAFDGTHSARSHVHPAAAISAREVRDLVEVAEGPIEVVLVEDQQIYLAGLHTVLTSDPDISVIAEFESLEALSRSRDWFSDIIVVVRQGLATVADCAPLRELSRRGIAVLVLAEPGSESDLVVALRAGARGCLSRRLSAHQLRDGVHALARDEPAFDSLVSGQLLKYILDEPRSRPNPKALPAIEQLTQRQWAVALLVAEGLSNDDIAARLHVSQATVKSHIGAMMRRLEVRSRTQLAILVNRRENLSA